MKYARFLIVTVASIFVVAALARCAAVRTLANLENCEYTIRDVRPRVSLAIPVSESTIDFDMMLDIRNPNDVELRLDRVDFNLLVNDSDVVSGFSDERIRIPANGVGDVRLKARVGYQNLRSLFREIADVVQGQRARYQLRGRAYFDTALGRVDFPFRVSRTVD